MLYIHYNFFCLSGGQNVELEQPKNLRALEITWCFKLCVCKLLKWCVSERTQSLVQKWAPIIRKQVLSHQSQVASLILSSHITGQHYDNTYQAQTYGNHSSKVSMSKLCCHDKLLLLKKVLYLVLYNKQEPNNWLP